MTKRADHEGKACYLESSNTANLKLYESIGFVVGRQIVLSRAKENVCLDIMVREPRASHSTEDEYRQPTACSHRSDTQAKAMTEDQ